MKLTLRCMCGSEIDVPFDMLRILAAASKGETKFGEHIEELIAEYVNEHRAYGWHYTNGEIYCEMCGPDDSY